MSDHVQNWVDVAAEEDCVEGHAVEVLVDGQVIAIFHEQGEWFAMDGMCAHQGGPIAQGHVASGCVTCPWHGWQYELSTGIQTINRQPLQKTYAVRACDGRIEVDMNS